MPGLNASSYLLSQGWAGPGHPLNPTAYRQHGQRGLAYDPKSASSASSSYFAAGGNGLIRPLLVSKKEGTLGLGRRAHEPAKGNEWWLKGFESALSSVGGTPSGASTPTAASGANGERSKERQAQEELQRKVNAQLGKFGGLYTYFLKGEVVGGTLPADENACVGRSKKSTSRKRKSDILTDSGTESDDQTPSGPAEAIPKRRKTTTSSNKDSARKKAKLKSKKPPPENDHDHEDATTQFTEIATFFTARDNTDLDKKRRRKDDKERRRNQRASQAFRAAGAFLDAAGAAPVPTPARTEDVNRRTNPQNGYHDDDINDDDGDSNQSLNGKENAQNQSQNHEKKSKHRQRQRRTVLTASGDEREETREERRARREARRLDRQLHRKKRRKSEG